MRFIPQFLAILLAITSIATPCVAKTQIGDIAPKGGVSANLSVEIEKGTCHGTCIKAIVTRQEDNTLSAIVLESNDNLIGPDLRRNRFQFANRTTIDKPPNAVCSKSVDLFVLCRQLN